MSKIIECCSKCGSTFLGKYPKMVICTDCADRDNALKNKTTIYYSKFPQEYYEELSLQKYGEKGRWKDIFVEIELSQEPSFSVQKYQTSLAKERERVERASQKQKVPVNKPNIPKCPTCSSTDIKKISTSSKVFGAAMFGLFSKNAQSQFVCNNCGYKW